jgi:hypothetical protein
MGHPDTNWYTTRNVSWYTARNISTNGQIMAYIRDERDISIYASLVDLGMYFARFRLLTGWCALFPLCPRAQFLAMHCGKYQQCALDK